MAFKCLKFKGYAGIIKFYWLALNLLCLVDLWILKDNLELFKNLVDFCDLKDNDPSYPFLDTPRITQSINSKNKLDQNES